MVFGTPDWINKKLVNFRKKGCKKWIIDIIGEIEDIASISGSLKVLFVLWKIKEPERYTTLGSLTELNTASLNKALKKLVSKGLISYTEEEIKEPRKQKVRMYSITKNGEKLGNSIFGILDQYSEFKVIEFRDIETSWKDLAKIFDIKQEEL